MNLLMKKKNPMETRPDRTGETNQEPTEREADIVR
jgi:hypothetical protein